MFKAGRRLNTKWEIEGSINSFVGEFNAEVTNAMLSDCQIQWVTEGNQADIIEDGKAIIRLSYDKSNHDLNFYNAAYSFVRTALLSRAKPYINELTVKGIDLLMTRELIQKQKRSGLTVFNQRFKQENEAVKKVYYQLEEIEKKGLFKLLVVQELFFFGETIGEKAPTIEHEKEVDCFVDWVYEIAQRESGEKTDLQYESANIKAAIILVASQETLNRYGEEAYSRRAKKNASNGYPIIYILARGEKRSRIAVAVAENLERTGCFGLLTKKYFITRFHENRSQIITCIPLKTEVNVIIQQAWKQFEQAYKESKTLTVIIEMIADDSVVVDAFGLKVPIKKDCLSNLSIKHLNRYFSIGAELEVKVVSFDQARDIIELSNKGTKTDPEKFVNELNNAINIELSATVAKIIVKDNYEIGVSLRLDNLDVPGFIRREKALYSRFVSLNEKYRIGDVIRVKTDYFDVNHVSFVCSVAGLVNPWNNIERYAINATVTGTVREILDEYITVEVEEGVEGRVFANELSWDAKVNQRELINKFKTGDAVSLKLLGIDERRRVLVLSQKRLENNPLESFFGSYSDKILLGKITSINSQWAIVALNNGQFEGFLPRAEASWHYCDDLRRFFKIGDEIKVRLLSINQHHNNLVISAKQVEDNKYDSFISSASLSTIVKARIIDYYDGMARVKIFYCDDFCVEGYVHKSELSTLTFITENNMPLFLEQNKVYDFEIKRFAVERKLVELSRKSFLKNNMRTLEVSSEHTVKVVSLKDGEACVTCNAFEANLIKPKNKRIKVGEEISSYIVAVNNTGVIVQVD
jgi:ribosomal protein S1